MSRSRIKAQWQKNRGIRLIRMRSDQSTLSRSIRYSPDQFGKARVSQTETQDQSGDARSIRADQSDIAGSIHNYRNSKIKINQRLWFFDRWGRCQIKGARLCSSLISMWEAQERSLTLKNIQAYTKNKRKNLERRAKHSIPPTNKLAPFMSIHWRSMSHLSASPTLYIGWPTRGK